MKNKKIIYYVLLCIIWAIPLKRLTVTNWENGYYFSRQPDSEQKWVNTDNINGLNISADYTAQGIKYNFRKFPSQRIIVRVLYGVPLPTYRESEFKGLKNVIFVDGSFKKDILKRPGFVLFKKDTPGETFSVALKKGEGSLEIRRIEVSVLAPRSQFLPNLPLFLLLLTFPIIASAFIKDAKIGFLYLAVALVIYLGANIRWQEIERVAYAPPYPDISYPNIGSGYYQHATEMKLGDKQKGFFSSYDLHEPGFPLVIKAFLAATGKSLLHVSFVSFFFSLIALILIFSIGRRLIGNGAALLATFLISNNAFLAEQASYGLRTEIEMVMLLVFFWLSFYGIKKIKLTVWCLVAGLTGGFWIIIRSFNLIPVIAIGAISLITHKVGLRRGLAAFLVFAFLSASLLLPYKYNTYKKRGSPFWDTNQYATSHANLEFKNSPGFPRKEITFAEYLFKLHSLKELVLYNATGIFVIGFLFYQELFSIIQLSNNLIKYLLAQGLKNTLFNYTGHFFLSFTLFILFLLCIFLGSLNKEAGKIWITVILSVSFSAFLYGMAVFKGGGVFEQHRSIAHILPLIALLFSAGFTTLYKITKPWFLKR